VKKAKILYIHHRPELGGAPVSLGGLIGALDRRRFEPFVYCPPGPAERLFRETGATVITGPVAGFTHIWASYYSGLRWLLFARELAQLPAASVRLTQTLRRFTFDIVHLNDSPLVYSALLARWARSRVVWHLRSAFAHGGLDTRGRTLGRLIDATADAVIAIDDDVARSFSGRVPVHIVHNSVDLDRFMPAPSAEAKRRLGLRDDLVSVGLFGYLYAKKGWPDFLAAARRLVQRGVPAQFLIVGGGVRSSEFFETMQGRLLAATGLTADEEQRARDAVRAFGIEDRVHFLPFSSDPRDLYWALDIVTFPNRGEGLGRAVIEASACGRPIVASGSLGGAGLVDADVTGRLVPRRSPDALAVVLEELVLDEPLRRKLGENARRHAEERFDTTRNGRAVMDVYEEVLAKT
jgi:glycosyltransferase involved in cell wall biosynthesis